MFGFRKKKQFYGEFIEENMQKLKNLCRCRTGRGLPFTVLIS
jgi:hypothetical protein